VPTEIRLKISTIHLLPTHSLILHTWLPLLRARTHPQIRISSKVLVECHLRGLVCGKSYFQRHQITVWTACGQLSYWHGILVTQPEPSRFQYAQLAIVSSPHKSRPRDAPAPHADYKLSTCKKFDDHSTQLKMSFKHFTAFIALASLANGTSIYRLNNAKANDYLYSCPRPPRYLF
jgi:hypothetical protein